MKLFYRGVSYNYDPTQARPGNTGRPTRSPQASQVPYRLIYRGVTLEVDPQAGQNSASVNALPESYDLIYRGTTYHVDRRAQWQNSQLQNSQLPNLLPNPDARSIVGQGVRVPAALPRHYISKVHQANIAENLQRRLRIAQAQGDENLVKLLQEEQRQMVA